MRVRVRVRVRVKVRVRARVREFHTHPSVVDRSMPSMPASPQTNNLIQANGVEFRRLWPDLYQRNRRTSLI